MSTKSRLSQGSYESAADDNPGEWVDRFNAVDEKRLRAVLQAERASIRAEFQADLSQARAEITKQHGDLLPWLYFGFWCVFTLAFVSLIFSVVGRR